MSGVRHDFRAHQAVYELTMRPNVLNPLFAAITSLAGVGPKLEKLFRHLLGREDMPRVVDLPTSPKDTSRLSHWPPEHWAQWRMEKLTPWKLKSWKFKNWD